VIESELRGVSDTAVSDTAVGAEVPALTEAQAAGMSEDQLLQAAIQVERERERESARERGSSKWRCFGCGRVQSEGIST